MFLLLLNFIRDQIIGRNLGFHCFESTAEMIGRFYQVKLKLSFFLKKERKMKTNKRSEVY